MLGDCVEYGWTNSYSVVASDLHYELHLWLVGFLASMRSAVVLIETFRLEDVNDYEYEI